MFYYKGIIKHRSPKVLLSLMSYTKLKDKCRNPFSTHNVREPKDKQILINDYVWHYDILD